MILHSDDQRFWDAIRQLGSEQEWQSSLYTRGALNWYRQRPADETKELSDQSFALIWEDQPVFAFVGALVSDGSGRRLLAYEAPAVSLESERLTRRAGKAALDVLRGVLYKADTVWYRDWLVHGAISSASECMLSAGAVAAPVFSSVLDLSQDEVQLKNNLRKSYRSLINWGLRELQPQVFEGRSLTWEDMNEFRALHVREAGRETRSEASWRRQFEMVEASEAFVVEGRLDGEMVSAGFFCASQTHCYYGSSASRRDLFEQPLFHSLMWSAILHAKERGCRWFEVGEQAYPNHPRDPRPSDKARSISEFKHGFGGGTRMFLDLGLDHPEASIEVQPG